MIPLLALALLLAVLSGCGKDTTDKPIQHPCAPQIMGSLEEILSRWKVSLEAPRRSWDHDQWTASLPMESGFFSSQVTVTAKNESPTAAAIEAVRRYEFMRAVEQEKCGGPR